MNLNTLQRHQAFGAHVTDVELIEHVASRITDADDIRRSRQFLTAYLNAADDVPQQTKAALQEAAELACGNIPELPGAVVIGLDVSDSMCRT